MTRILLFAIPRAVRRLSFAINISFANLGDATYAVNNGQASGPALIGAFSAQCPAVDPASIDIPSNTVGVVDNGDGSGTVSATLKFLAAPAEEARFLRACIDAMDLADGASGFPRFLPVINSALAAAQLAGASGLSVGPVAAEVEYDIAGTAFVAANGSSVSANTIYQRWSDPGMPAAVSTALIADVAFPAVRAVDVTLPGAPPPGPPPAPPVPPFSPPPPSPPPGPATPAPPSPPSKPPDRKSVV